MSELRFLGELGLTPRWALQAAIPLRVIDTRTRFTDLDGDRIQLDYDNIHHRDERLVGLGDVQLLLHASHRVGRSAVGLRAGLSLPTGRVHEDPFRLGAEGMPHQHIQLGTGTFDPIAALDVGRTAGDWSFSAFGQAQIPLYEGGQGYRAGIRSLAGLVAARRFGSASVRLGVTAAREGAERWDGDVPAEDGNRGRTDLYAGPGLTLPFGADYSASIDVNVRAYGQTAGAQLDMPVVVSLSVGRLFHLERGRHVEPVAAEPAGGDVADAVHAGEARELAPVPGKWTVFDFWATWCEACFDLDARLRAMARADDDLAVRRVNIVDLDSPIARRELPEVTTLPRIRLVDPGGRTVWEASGTPDELVEGIRARMQP